jgi:alpha-galactosidase
MKHIYRSNSCCGIHTTNQTILYRTLIGAPLELLYFGTRITDERTISALEGAASAPEAYPAFGAAYRRSPAFRVSKGSEQQHTSARLLYTGSEAADEQTLVLSLFDSYLQLEVSLIIEADYEYDMIGMYTRVTNCSDTPCTIDYMAAAFLPLSWKEGVLTNFTGSWAHEMHMNEQRLNPGIHITGERCGIRTTRFANPTIILSHGGHPAGEQTGICIGAAYAWSGNWAFLLDHDPDGTISLIAGDHPDTARRILSAGASYQMPHLYLTHSESGRGTVSRRFHRWAKQRMIPDAANPRSIVLNSWEAAYFDFDETLLLQMIDGAARIGIETFVLDDGWFGSDYPRDDDTQGLGDWQVQSAKLPRGLTPLIDRCRERGMTFGLWIEPEMVNPRSRLFEQHPEWILSAEHREASLERGQYVLDLSREEVLAWVIGTIEQILDQNPGIDYIKWDCNRDIKELSGGFSVYDRYVENYYRILEHLGERYPALVIQDCASGGGRVEYGALHRTHEFWASDNTDALQRIFIQWGTGMFYPPSVTAAHVGSETNHITGRHLPLAFRCSVAMSCRFGVELSPLALSGEDREFLCEAVSTYKGIRHLIVYGELYRLVSPYEQHHAAIMYVLPDRSEALLFVWELRFSVGSAYEQIRLTGLQEDCMYEVQELLAEHPEQHMMNPVRSGPAAMRLLTGEYLQRCGLAIAFRHEYDSRIFHFVMK